MKKRLICFLLALSLTLTLLPAASAAKTTVTALHMTGFQTPVVGMKAGDVMPAVAEDVEIVDSYWWCDTDWDEMDPADVFEAGKEYSCFIKLLANADFYEISEEAECYLNGSTEFIDTSITHRGGDVFYFWTKPLEAAEKPTLTALHMTGWQTPVVGRKAGDLTPTVTEDVEIYAGFWYCDTDGDDMDPADTFEAGKSYSYCLGMWIETENYVISPSASLFVNGSTELVDTFYSRGDDETFAIWTKPVEAVSASGKVGDVDLDSDVSASDLTKLARHVGGIEALTDAQAKKNADYNGDGDITSDDLTALARIVAKI